MNTPVNVSVVIPVYNEEANLPELLPYSALRRCKRNLS